MKYLVTVQGMRPSTEVYSVEAATEEEARISALDLAHRSVAKFNPGTLRIESVVEDIERAHGPVGMYAGAGREPHLRSLI